MTAPYSKNLYINAVKQVFPEAVIDTISDFRSCADIWIGKYLYSHEYDSPEIDDLELLGDVICRDRVLCVADREKANLIVTRCLNGLRELFSKNIYDFMFSGGIDRYFRDIAFRVAEEFNVFAVSPMGSFYYGYAWFTRRGERIPLSRNIESFEVERLCSTLLETKYLPKSEESNVLRNQDIVRKEFTRRKLIELIFNPIRRTLSRDPCNTQYNIVTFPSGKRFRDFYSTEIELMFTHVNELSISSESTVYLPMHLIPEATTSYWCKDVAHLGYLSYLLNIIESSDSSVQFLVKEHPSMIGRRELSFYNELLKCGNVSLIHPLDRSNDVLSLVDTVAVDTGTVGVEALIRGKRALCLEDSYYSSLHPNALRVNVATLESLHSPLASLDERLFAQQLLDGWFISDYVNDKNQNSCSVDQLSFGLRLLDNAYNISK